MYQYRAAVLRVVDGDTVHVRVDLGFDVRLDMTLRLYGINTPELPTPEGVAAKDFAISWLAHHADFRLESLRDKREKFGRYLGIIHPLDGGETLNDALIRSGNAVPYMVTR